MDEELVLKVVQSLEERIAGLERREAERARCSKESLAEIRSVVTVLRGLSRFSPKIDVGARPQDRAVK